MLLNKELKLQWKINPVKKFKCIACNDTTIISKYIFTFKPCGTKFTYCPHAKLSNVE